MVLSYQPRSLARWFCTCTPMPEGCLEAANSSPKLLHIQLHRLQRHHSHLEASWWAQWFYVANEKQTLHFITTCFDLMATRKLVMMGLSKVKGTKSKACDESGANDYSETTVVLYLLLSCHNILTWSTVGLILATDRTSSICRLLKLERPMALTKPFPTNFSMAAHVSL